jgi:hypothetical protein
MATQEVIHFPPRAQLSPRMLFPVRTPREPGAESPPSLKTAEEIFLVQSEFRPRSPDVGPANGTIGTTGARHRPKCFDLASRVHHADDDPTLAMQKTSLPRS